MLGHWRQGKELALIFGPARLAVFGGGLFLLWLLYRRITSLGRLTVTFWVGVLAVIAWITIEGAWHFDRRTAFDFSGRAEQPPTGFGWKLGAAMILAIYSYLGYYNVCYIGDEVRDPARTIPRSIQAQCLAGVRAVRRPAPGDARHGALAVGADRIAGRWTHSACRRRSWPASTARGAGRYRWCRCS